MPTSSRIRRPSLEADVPRLAPSLTIGVAAFLLGIVLARSTLAPAPPRPPTAEPVTALPSTDPVTPPPSLPPTPAATPPNPPPTIPKTAPAEPPPRALGPLRMERGRVAYVRCDGIRLRPGAYPCPRDGSLEEKVWTALEALPRCRPPRSFGGDLRLYFRKGTLDTTRLRSDDEELATDGLLACLRGELGKVSTPIRADPLIVSFRFGLVGGGG